MLEVIKTALPGVLEIIPKRFGDDRGYFVETFNADRLKHVGLDVTFCQDNHSYSRDIGVLRGLHYQMAPFAQDKLVRVTRGRVFDVAVDLRQGSQAYSKWVGVELSAEKGNQLFIPQGFAHAFLTLEHDCEFQYKVCFFLGQRTASLPGDATPRFAACGCWQWSTIAAGRFRGCGTTARWTRAAAAAAAGPGSTALHGFRAVELHDQVPLTQTAHARAHAGRGQRLAAKPRSNFHSSW